MARRFGNDHPNDRIFNDALQHCLEGFFYKSVGCNLTQLGLDGGLECAGYDPRANCPEGPADQSTKGIYCH
jgi:hypothetical protein